MADTRAPLSIAVLASGRGSNLQAIFDAIAAGCLDVRVAGVFSDRSDAPALQRARDRGVPAHAFGRDDFATRRAFDRALFDAVRAVSPGLVVCAGFMRVIGAVEVERLRGRIVNIHPSLLPAFKGLHTHRQALDAGVVEHGASVHFVTAALDGGPVIAQACVPVHAGDDVDALAARVLHQEHRLLVETLRWFAAGRIALAEDGVQIDGGTRVPLQLAANGRFA